MRSTLLLSHIISFCSGTNTRKHEWKHKKRPSLFDRYDDNNMSNKVRHPSSSTKLTFYKYYDNPSEVMFNNGHQNDNFSTAKASSFVNVTKKRKVKDNVDARTDQNFDDIQTMSTNTNKQHTENKNYSLANFCSINEQHYDDSVINGGNFERTSYLNNYAKPKADNPTAHFSKGKLVTNKFIALVAHITYDILNG